MAGMITHFIVVSATNFLNWHLQICVRGTCPLTPEELKAQARQYKDKLRTNRILQVCLEIEH